MAADLTFFHTRYTKSLSKSFSKTVEPKKKKKILKKKKKKKIGAGEELNLLNFF